MEFFIVAVILVFPFFSVRITPLDDMAAIFFLLDVQSIFFFFMLDGDITVLSFKRDPTVNGSVGLFVIFTDFIFAAEESIGLANPTVRLIPSTVIEIAKVVILFIVSTSTL